MSDLSARTYGACVVAVVGGLGVSVILFSGARPTIAQEETGTYGETEPSYPVQEETVAPSRRATTRQAPSAGTKAKEAAIERKLDQILANQATILQKFDAIMEELRIIKIRATLGRGGSSE